MARIEPMGHAGSYCVTSNKTGKVIGIVWTRAGWKVQDKLFGSLELAKQYGKDKMTEYLKTLNSRKCYYNYLPCAYRCFEPERCLSFKPLSQISKDGE